MSDDAGQPTAHGEQIPGAEAFAADRATWRRGMGEDTELRQTAIDLQVRAEDHRYTYQWEWLGVPIIRLPDDVMVLQELIWTHRPERIIETGVARGGSIILDASLQRLCGLEPRVLGIDIAIHAHARDAIEQHPLAAGITLLEADSASDSTRDTVASFLEGAGSAALVLDSDHTHDHVLAELRALAPLLPKGSYVLVADTLIEEFPEGHYERRSWDRGNNPLTAVRAFVEEHDDFEQDATWGRRGLLSEFRDGILCRTR